MVQIQLSCWSDHVLLYHLISAGAKLLWKVVLKIKNSVSPGSTNVDPEWPRGLTQLGIDLPTWQQLASTAPSQNSPVESLRTWMWKIGFWSKIRVNSYIFHHLCSGFVFETSFTITLHCLCPTTCLARWINSFCAKGTRFRPSSTPRSPRATMRAWDLAMMPSMLVKACQAARVDKTADSFNYRVQITSHLNIFKWLFNLIQTYHMYI